MGDHHEAEDAFHEVFLKVRRGLPGYEDRGAPFSAWVLRITRNHLHDHRAKRTRTEPQVPEVIDRRREAVLGSVRASTQRSPINELTLELPDSQRRALFLRFQFGYSAEEIAEALGISANAVRHLQHRALRTLRDTGEVAA